MADCGCSPNSPEIETQRKALWLALVLNALMFLVETTAGILVSSAGLIADGLDMLSDAAVYSIALIAIGRTARFKANSALLSGIALLGLGIGLIFEVARRLLDGSTPEGPWMIVIATIALAVNIIVLRLLSRQRSGEVHMRAAWIFTRADVVANGAVIVSGVAVVATGSRYFDLIVGAAIGAYVIREAFEIIAEAISARRNG